MYAKPISGIYKILNKKNNKFYIGSSNDIYGRWASHKSQLKRNIHTCTYLQNSWNKYGEDAFEFSVIEEVIENDLLECEQRWLDLTKCYESNIGFNVLQKAGSNTGFKHSEDTKNKISKKLKGKLKPRNKPKKQKEVKVHGAKLIGRRYSEEHKRKISEANKNRILSEEHKAKLRKPKKKVSSGN